MIRTHNAYHLGDNLVHLNFLRRVAQANPDQKFIHYCQWQYLDQLHDVISDIPNIELGEFNYLLGEGSIDSWRGAGGFWYAHPNRNNFGEFHLEWFEHLAKRMHVENPVREIKDLLFDYPNILQSLNGDIPIPFDVLMINSVPESGQFRSFDRYELRRIALALAEKGCKVVCTRTYAHDDLYGPLYYTTDLSVTEIGHLSLHCHTIVMVPTGPGWPTFNIWNLANIKNRIILLDSERVDLAPNTVHCQRIVEAEEILKGSGLL